MNNLRKDYGDIEVDNVFRTLNKLNNDLSNIDYIEESIITRLIDDKDLLKDIYSIREKRMDSIFDWNEFF